MPTTPSGGVLRYPYEAITNTTDYLQLTIFKYDKKVGTNQLVDEDLSNSNPYSSQGFAAQVDKAKVLSDDGVIILPMPSNIQDSNSVSYEGGSMNDLQADALTGVGALMAADLSKLGSKAEVFSEDNRNKLEGLRDKFTSGGADSLKDLLLSQLAVSAVNVFGANVSLDQLLARSGGKIINPNMELLFNNVTLRTFRFSFKMTPRDENEATSIKSIIRSLKKNMAAKTRNDFFLDTPNIFELQYKKGNRPHPFLNTFKICALSDMSVNYTGENVYATYSDGTPISMVMTLTFKELLPIYSEDYDFRARFDGSEYPEDGVGDFQNTDLIYNTEGTPPNKQQTINVQGVGF